MSDGHGKNEAETSARTRLASRGYAQAILNSKPMPEGERATLARTVTALYDELASESRLGAAARRYAEAHARAHEAHTTPEGEALPLEERDRLFDVALDARRESQRLRENAALGREATEGETPVIQRSRSSNPVTRLLESIF